MPTPIVTVHSVEEGAKTVFLHIGQMVRTIFAPDTEAALHRAEAVAVSEFGASADEAKQVAEKVGAAIAGVAAGPGAEAAAAAEETLTNWVRRALKAEADSRLLPTLRADYETALSKAKEEIAGLRDLLGKISPDDLKAHDQARSGAAEPGVGRSEHTRAQSPSASADGAQPGEPAAQQNPAPMQPPSPRVGSTTETGATPSPESQPARTQAPPAPNPAGAGGTPG